MSDLQKPCTCCCPKKPVRKDWLEFKVIQDTMELLFQQTIFENVAQQLVTFINKKAHLK